MTLRKKASAALFACALIFWASTAFAGSGEINIALWKLPLNVPAMAALEDKTYEKTFEGEMKVNYVPLPSGPKQIQAIAAGKLDIAEGLGDAATLVGAANGVELVIIGANSRSPRAFAIMATDPEIKSVADLKGKKVAGLRGSVVHRLFVELLSEAKISDKDVEFFTMPLKAAGTALASKQVDAALLVGTEITRAQKSGAKIIADARGRLQGLSLIVARAKFARENPEAIKKYLEARKKITESISKEPDKFIPLIMKEAALNENEAKEMLSWFDFSAVISKEDIKELNKTLKYLEQEKMIRTKPAPDKLLFNSSTK